MHGHAKTDPAADRELGNFLKWGGACVTVVGVLTGFALIGHEVAWLFPMGIGGIGAFASRIGQNLVCRADRLDLGGR